jgi:hypothetical protein
MAPEPTIFTPLKQLYRLSPETDHLECPCGGDSTPPTWLLLLLLLPATTPWPLPEDFHLPPQHLCLERKFRMVLSRHIWQMQGAALVPVMVSFLGPRDAQMAGTLFQVVSGRVLAEKNCIWIPQEYRWASSTFLFLAPYWDLNSGSHACWAGSLILEPLRQPFIQSFEGPQERKLPEDLK